MMGGEEVSEAKRYIFFFDLYTQEFEALSNQKQCHVWKIVICSYR